MRNVFSVSLSTGSRFLLLLTFSIVPGQTWRSCCLVKIFLHILGWTERCQMERRWWITLWCLWDPCRRTTLGFTGVRWQMTSDCTVETLEYVFRVSKRLETWHPSYQSLPVCFLCETGETMVRNNIKTLPVKFILTLLKCWH